MRKTIAICSVVTVCLLAAILFMSWGVMIYLVHSKDRAELKKLREEIAAIKAVKKESAPSPIEKPRAEPKPKPQEIPVPVSKEPEIDRAMVVGKWEPWIARDPLTVQFWEFKTDGTGSNAGPFLYGGRVPSFEWDMAGQTCNMDTPSGRLNFRVSFEMNGQKMIFGSIVLRRASAERIEFIESKQRESSGAVDQ